jgi:hypothetical protein
MLLIDQAALPGYSSLKFKNKTHHFDSFSLVPPIIAAGVCLKNCLSFSICQLRRVEGN